MFGPLKLVVAFLLVSASSLLADEQDFKLHNQTGVCIDKVFISPSDVSEWQEDVLGVDQLPNGEVVEIKFDRTEEAAVWDIKITDTAGASVEWKGLNLLEISDVTLKLEDGVATAEWE